MKYKLLSILLALCLAVGGLAASVYLLGTGSMTMRIVMERYAPAAVTGLPAEEYTPVVEMITGYLKGADVPFQHIFTLNGTDYAAFNQKEQQHMADVQQLFRLCKVIAFACLGGFVITMMFLHNGETDCTRWRIFRRTLLTILAAIGAVIVLACIDFDSLFILFHKIAFTNDLWLLNPQTDLLIRLMPIEFFILYAVLIGLLWLTGMAVLLVYSTVCIHKKQTTEGE